LHAAAAAVPPSRDCRYREVAPGRGVFPAPRFFFWIGLPLLNSSVTCRASLAAYAGAYGLGSCLGVCEALLVFLAIRSSVEDHHSTLADGLRSRVGRCSDRDSVRCGWRGTRSSWATLPASPSDLAAASSQRVPMAPRSGPGSRPSLGAEPPS